MGLIGNYSVLAKNPGRFFSGASLPQIRTGITAGALHNRFLCPENLGNNQSISLPSGYTGGYAYSLATSTPNLASYTLLRGKVTVPLANCQAGFYIDSTITTSGVVDSAELSLVAFVLGSIACQVSTSISGDLLADISGSGSGQITIATANLQNGTVSSDVSIDATSTLTASGSLSVARTASITSTVSSTANLTNGAAATPASISCSVVFTGNISALAGVSATILPFTELSPESLANAVWNEVTGTRPPGSFGNTVQQIKSLTTASL